jgi:hypothetical protein
MHVDAMTNLAGQHIVPNVARDGNSMCFASKAFHLLNIMARSIRVVMIS